MNRKRKTAGFTLVELIIAVAILGIVISPLIANFIQSAKINRKAKISLNATNMAQDILEGASSYSATEFISMFESEASLVNQVLPAGLTYTTHGDMEAAGMNAASGNEKYVATVGSFDVSDGAVGNRQYAKSVVGGLTKELKSIDDAYLFANGVKQGKNEYNLRFHVSTSNAQNKKDVANIATINKTYDATYNLYNTEAEAAADEFVNRSSDAWRTRENYLQVMNRTVTIDIQAKDDTGTDYAVAIDTKYEIPSGMGVADAQRIITYSKANISNLDATKLPRSVYLYFNGMKYTQIGNVKDHIVIKNNTDKDITVYLVRIQKEADATSNLNYNNNYCADVAITSTNYDGSTPNTKTYIVSNLRYNLSKSAEENIRVLQEGSYSEVVAGSGYTATTPTEYKQARCSYSYNGASLTEDLYLTNFSAGYQQKRKNFIYDVTLDIWDVKTNKKVATFTGSLSD